MSHMTELYMRPWVHDAGHASHSKSLQVQFYDLALVCRLPVE